jgi:hypothetical protein
MYSKLNVSMATPMLIEGERRHFTAYELVFADRLHSEGP